MSGDDKPDRRKMETGISLDKDVIRELDSRAALLGLSRSAMVNMVVRQAFGMAGGVFQWQGEK